MQALNSAKGKDKDYYATWEAVQKLYKKETGVDFAKDKEDAQLGKQDCEEDQVFDLQEDIDAEENRLEPPQTAKPKSTGSCSQRKKEIV